MVKTNNLPAIASIAFLALSASTPAQAQQSSVSFFVTSVGPGKGGDLGGLEGADRLCCVCAGALVLKARNAMDAIAGKLFVLTIPVLLHCSRLANQKLSKSANPLTTGRHRKFIS